MMNDRDVPRRPHDQDHEEEEEDDDDDDAAAEREARPLLVSVGSDGARTIHPTSSTTGEGQGEGDQGEGDGAPPSSSSMSVVAPGDDGRMPLRLESQRRGGDYLEDMFHLERRRREVERRLREIEARETRLRNLHAKGKGAKRGRGNEDTANEEAQRSEAPEEEEEVQPKRRLLSSAVLTSTAAASEGRGHKREREGYDQDPRHDPDARTVKRRAEDREDENSGHYDRARSGGEEAERERIREQEEAERERRRKEREQKEKEWVKKASNTDTTRNRRVFGVLLGTLQRFRKDQTAVAEKERAREQIAKQVEEKVKEESEKVFQEEQTRLNEEKQRQLVIRDELTKQIEDLQLAALQARWEEHRKLVGRFRKTETKPQICFSFNESSASSSAEVESDSDSKRHRHHRDASDSSDSSDNDSSDSESDDHAQGDKDEPPTTSTE